MLTITRYLYDAIVAHARAEHPIEACGIVAGIDRPTRIEPMLNADWSETSYTFDPDEQLWAWRQMDTRDEEPLIVYHSHTATEAYPSRTDVAYATEPGAHYVIVSTRDADGLGEFQFRSFRIAGGTVTEEPVVIDGSGD
jgi:[CysO sulfur-carrier protein]-S-L-cysteine hydrolase